MYSLRKSTHILKEAFSRYKRREKKLYPKEKEELFHEMQALNAAILEKNKASAHLSAKSVQAKLHKICPKNIFDHGIELVLALIFALVVATLVRTMWFELYEIPTGSMRPTFKEQDNIIASKTTFGINVPLIPKHFLFEKDLVKRSDIVIFTVENMDVINPDTVYFYLFPGKRLLIKRLIGKPGDSIYFYGGKIYGIDREGHMLPELTNSPWLKGLDHTPFISYDGRIKRGATAKEFLLTQTNQPLAKLSVTGLGNIKGTIFNGENWVTEDPKALKSHHEKIESYSDFWGFKNYGMVLLYTKEEIKKYTDFSPGDGLLYMEISHTPNLTYPAPRLIKDEYGRVRPTIVPQKTLIPLHQEHLDRLMDGLYTARFVVKNERASRYSNETTYASAYDVPMPGIPDGTYEFYYGKAYKVVWGGTTLALPANHPLYRRDLSTIQTLFNLGIEFNTLYAPHSKDALIFPQRFAYFRDGSLYTMGTPIFFKDDPVLMQFTADELQKESTSSDKQPYAAFVDQGAPSAKTIETFGMKVPEGMYFVLGDNYAMSADSRDFGFVPEENLRGSAAFIVWPIGGRLGTPDQPPSPWFTAPTLIIWSLFIIIVVAWELYQRRRLRHIREFLRLHENI